MPVHEWTRVEAGIFHAFHHGWIAEIARAFNSGVLPEDHYALAEQIALRSGLELLELQSFGDESENLTAQTRVVPDLGGLELAAPSVPLVAETDTPFYRRKQKCVTVRHVSSDQIVAVVDIMSPGNKSGLNALRAFVDKVALLLEREIHLLVLDLHPSGLCDPQGIHGAIWKAIADESYAAPADKPLTLASYECALTTRAYVVHCSVGDTLTDMPLFLEPGGHVQVPLEATYQAAFAAVPRRWRVVLERPAL